MSDTSFEIDPLNVPIALKSRFESARLNEAISIWVGNFKISQNSNTYSCIGKIELRWLPIPKMQFYCDIQDASFLMSVNFDEVKILLNESLSAFGKINQVKKSQNHCNISGTIFKFSSAQDSVKLSLVKFAIPNLRNIGGDNLRISNKFYHGRNELNGNGYNLRFDKRQDYDEISKYLNISGGYGLQYFGEISKANGEFTYEEVSVVLNIFSLFISFLNGRKTAPVLIDAMKGDTILFTDWKPYQFSHYKYTRTWIPNIAQLPLTNMWTNFLKICNDPEDLDAFQSLIHWYVEANSNSGLLEGSIMMAQAAIELLFNWIVCEKLSAIDIKDIEKVNASTKTRMLWASIGIKENEIEISQHMKDFIKMESGISTLSQAMSWMRNSIVHGNESKRKRIKEVTDELKFETLSIYLWTVECSILSILKYTGEYHNRLSMKGNELFNYKINL